MNKPRGPRVGTIDLRARILEVARARFLAHGYEATTLRSVATEAGIDVALISYYFGSKHGLFSQTMALTVSPAEVLRPVLAGDRRDLPENLLNAVVQTWDVPEAAASLQALLAAVLRHPERLPVVQGFLQREVLRPLAEALGGDTVARTRAAGVTMIVAGIVTMRHVLGIDAMAELTPAQLETMLAPAIRAALDAPLMK